MVILNIKANVDKNPWEAGQPTQMQAICMEKGTISLDLRTQSCINAGWYPYPFFNKSENKGKEVGFL